LFEEDGGTVDDVLGAEGVFGVLFLVFGDRGGGTAGDGDGD